MLAGILMVGMSGLIAHDMHDVAKQQMIVNSLEREPIVKVCKASEAFTYNQYYV